MAWEITELNYFTIEKDKDIIIIELNKEIYPKDFYEIESKTIGNLDQWLQKNNIDISFCYIDKYENKSINNMCLLYIDIKPNSKQESLLKNYLYYNNGDTKFNGISYSIYTLKQAKQAKQININISKLYIDDIRVPKDETFVIVRSYQDAINYVQKNDIPMYISFDHDLGVDTNGQLLPTGFDFAKWLIEMDLDNTYIFPDNFKFNVHSSNPVGKHNIETILNNYLKFKVVYK